MSLAARVYKAVTEDAGVLASPLGPAPVPLRFYARGTLGRNGVPAQPATPYAMYGEGGTDPARVVNDSSPDTGSTIFTLYVYDEPGSFERIKDINQELRRVITSLSGTTTEEGMIVTEARWTSTSGDQYDAVSKLNVKHQTFLLVGKG